ncbi:hypothetical protein AAFN60_08520 [Roseibacillus persicicus]|uniref:hypothetical protein n=1 Tax=Roseibacillus persicicus TaxID=454148 RepID=UPI00398BA821
MKALFLLPLASLAACTPVDQPRIGQSPAGNRPAAVATSQSSLSAAQKAAIGQKIWQNESGGSRNGLTAWNAGEAFPSLGIGHFIWYPTGTTGPYTESFPQFIAFAKQRGANPPAIASNRGCPWPTRIAFQREFNSAAMTSLRDWLASNVSLQTDFIIAKSRASLPKILKAAGSDAARVQANYNRTATSASGQYALIDYVNFKGEGINPNERYNGQGWGLLQVLQEMNGTATGKAAAVEFSQAAMRVMARRVANSGGKDQRWHAGWQNRCATYAQPL